MSPADHHRFVFVGGLHRSGTSLVARALAEHPSVSGFRDTGAPEDEGVYLQDVYRGYGGWGRFGFDPRSHLTESSSLVSDASRSRLFAQWGRHWDLDKPVLLEKSPANLLRARFLQAMFPESWFVMVVRHPLAVAAATERWTRPVLPVGVGHRRGMRTVDRVARRVVASLRGPTLVRHWVVCHETLAEDLPSISRVAIVHYEDLVRDFDAELARLHSFVGLEPHRTETAVRAGLDECYIRRWRGDGRNPLKRLRSFAVAARYEGRVNRFGYSLDRYAPVGACYRLPSTMPTGRGDGGSSGVAGSSPSARSLRTGNVKETER